MCLTSAEGTVLRANAAMRKLPGFKAATGRRLHELLHPLDAAGLAAVLRDGETGERRFLLRGVPHTAALNGDAEPIAAVVAPGPTGTRFVTLLHDDSTCPESTARSARLRLQAMLESSPLAVIEWDMDRSARTWNTAAERLFGYTAAEAAHGDMFPLLVAEESVKIVDDVWQALAAGMGGSRVINTNRTKDGRTILCRWYNSVIRDESGRVTSVVSLAEDVTELEMANREVREARRRLERLIDHLPVFVWALDERLVPVLWNRCAAVTTGMPAARIIGNPEALSLLLGRRAAATRTIADRDFDDVEVEVNCDDGTRIIVSWSNLAGRCPIPGWRAWGIGIDVTSRRAAEGEVAAYRQHLEHLVTERTEALALSRQRLEAAERMASLGRLAAGLGHDIGNMILPLRCHLDTIDAAAKDPGIIAAAGALRTGLSFFDDLADGLSMLVSGGAEAELGDASSCVCDVARWWVELEPILRAALAPGVRFNARIDPGTPPPGLPGHLLSRVVLNLVVNASEAIERRSAAEGRPPHGVISVIARPEHGGPLLRVEDDGGGIPEEIRQQVFEPFFSTKTRSLSTGLGLSMVHAVVTRAGGTITLEGEPGHGTAVVISLPSPSPAATAAREPGAAALASYMSTRDTPAAPTRRGPHATT